VWELLRHERQLFKKDLYNWRKKTGKHSVHGREHHRELKALYKEAKAVFPSWRRRTKHGSR